MFAQYEKQYEFGKSYIDNIIMLNRYAGVIQD